MNDLPSLTRLSPRHVPKPWGGRRIETLLGHKLPGEDPIGESWLVFDRDGDSSQVFGGPLDGCPLSELRGDTPFPLLFKLLDACQPLSLQVHPDADAAARLGGEPKNECWFVLHAEPGAKVYRGLRDDCVREDVERALSDGRITDCLHEVEVAAGDTVYVPAGTLHTIGAGVLLAEIQQNSDTTYRLHDWDRVGLDGAPRELHVERALDTVRFGPRTEDKIPAQIVEDDGAVTRVLLVRSPHFTVEHVTAMGTFTLDVPPSADGSWPILHVLSGTGTAQPFDRKAAPVAMATGHTYLLPSRYDSFECELGTSVLRALVIRT